MPDIYRFQSLLISDASKRGVSSLAAAAEHGLAKVLERRGRPVAAAGYDALRRIASMERDAWTDVRMRPR